MSIIIEEIRGTESFNAIRDEWNELLARSAHDVPFLRHEWIRIWSEHFSTPETRTTIVATEYNRLLFALPLVECHRQWGPLSFNILSSTTNSHSFRFHYLLDQERPDALREVLRYLQGRKNWHLLLLSYVPLAIENDDRLLRCAGDFGLAARIKPMYESAILPIQGTWESYLAGLSKSYRKTMRRQERRLNEMGDVQIERLQSPDAVSEALPEALEIERRSWKGSNGSAIACRPNLVSFYSALSRKAAQLGWMKLSFLNVAGARVAFEIAFEYNKRLYSIKIGYDPDKYPQCSTGRRLVHESLAHSFQKKLLEYDFVGDFTAAQEHWEPELRHVGWVYLHNRRLLSKVHASQEFRLKPVVKKMIDAVRRTKN